ncbi:MAG: DUF4012 domain-containing protein [Patescibacteria group bacterium]|nr:DUF4012 domain-containing protein [Patescibacteria group bacterium]
MEGFEKIELDKTEAKKEGHSLSANKVQGKRKFSKKILIIIGVVVIFLAGSFFEIVLPAKKVYGSAKKTFAQAKIAMDAAKKQNIELADTELKKTKTELLQTQKDFKKLSYLRFIPILNNYYNDGDHLLKAGSYGIDAGLLLTDSIKPYADVLGLKGKGSFVMGSAEQRIQTAIMTMGKITPRIDEIATYVVKAKDEIDAVDPNHYPSFLGGGKVKDKLSTLKTTADQGASFIDEARPLIKVLPSLLGESKERKYLVLFQNDKELRPTGGFITAYAIFRIDKGIIHVDKSDDIYNLDNNIPGKTTAPEPILKYLPKVPTFNLRDSNLSPDFITSMKTFNTMYNKIPGRTDVDGIIAIDTNVLISTIKILDDNVSAAGIDFTTKEDKRCNCPSAIYVLEDSISRPVNFEKGGGRKDLLGTLLYSIMQKALSSSPKIYWGPLLQAMVTQASEKHILFYLYNEDAQKGIELLNAAGRIKDFDGDYLHINDTNFGGQKSNMYVQESVSQNIETQGDGNIIKTITIDYKNPYPPSDCNLERGGLCLNATLRDWLRIYVPKGSELIDSQGSEVKIKSYEEFGKTVFEGFLEVRPLGTAKFTIKYRLPFKPAKGFMPLMIQKQAGTGENEYSVKTNSKEVQKFKLKNDKEIKINL